MKPTTIAILGGIAALTVIYLTKQAATGAATVFQTIGDAVDPTNPGNIAYAGINKVGTVLTGPEGAGRNADGTWTFGGWFYDVTHPQTVYLRDSITRTDLPTYW